MESVGMLGFVYPQSWWLESVSLQLRRRGSRKESGYLVFPHRTLGGWTGSSLRALPALGCGASYSITSVRTPKWGNAREAVVRTCFTEQRLHPYLVDRLPLGLCWPFHHLYLPHKDVGQAQPAGSWSDSDFIFFMRLRSPTEQSLGLWKATCLFMIWKDSSSVSCSSVPVSYSSRSMGSFLGTLAYAPPSNKWTNWQGDGPEVVGQSCHRVYCYTFSNVGPHSSVDQRYERGMTGVSVEGLLRLKSKCCLTAFLS